MIFLEVSVYIIFFVSLKLGYQQSSFPALNSSLDLTLGGVVFCQMNSDAWSVASPLAVTSLGAFGCLYIGEPGFGDATLTRLVVYMGV